MRRIQIVDLDGCISDDRWRRHLIGPKVNGEKGHDRFDLYHAHCAKDQVTNLHEIIAPDTVVLTGRPNRYRAATWKWIQTVAKIEPLYLMMRNDNDFQPSSVLKAHMVRALFDVNSYNLHPEEVVFAIDDRTLVIEMYRQEFGIEAKVVRIGDEEHELG